MRKLLLVLAAFILFPSLTHARYRVCGWCERGGQVVVTPGSSGSTTKVQRSYPACTVTVYDAGTPSLSTLYSDNAGTAKGNSFTASTTGYWFFYADNGRYDIVLTGAGISGTLTIGDVGLYDPVPPPVVYTALPACAASLEGTLRLVIDSNTSVWGAVVAGSGANRVLVYCNGTAWTVAAK